MLNPEKLMEALFFDMPIPLWLFDFGERGVPHIEERSFDTEDFEAQLHRSIVLKDANRAALDLYEASGVEELREKLFRIIPHQSFAELLKARERLSSNEGHFETEAVHSTCKGKTVYVSLRFIPLTVAGNDRCVIVSAVDLTRYKALAEENALLAKLSEANPDIVVLLDCETKVRFVNPAGERMI